jgi:hypothetical protein
MTGTQKGDKSDPGTQRGHMIPNILSGKRMLVCGGREFTDYRSSARRSTAGWVMNGVGIDEHRRANATVAFFIPARLRSVSPSSSARCSL